MKAFRWSRSGLPSIFGLTSSSPVGYTECTITCGLSNIVLLEILHRCLYGVFSLWVGPVAMFTETVMVDGREVPRFERVGEEG